MAINPPVAVLGTKNAILWGKAKQYHVKDFPGPLSIKVVVRGSAFWATQEAERLVDGSTYLVLNSGQPYSLVIESSEVVETFCLLFRRGTVEDVNEVQATSAAKLLDRGPVCGSPSVGSDASVHFFEALHWHDSIVSPLITKMYASVANSSATDAWLDDQFLPSRGLCLKRMERHTSKRRRFRQRKPPLNWSCTGGCCEARISWTPACRAR